MKWDASYDVIAVGSGAAGFSVGITAKLNGLSPLIIEKTSFYGGSTALSGGGVWIPNNHYLKAANVSDSDEEAITYMNELIGEDVPKEVQEVYVKRGKEVLKFFHDRTNHIRFKYIPGYSDYYPEVKGGKPNGRSIEPEIFDLRKLGSDEATIRKSGLDTKGLCMNGYDFKHINMITRTMKGKTQSLKVGMRLIKSKLTGARLSSLGTALVARMRLSYKEVNGELWLNTAFKDYIIEDDRVVGILVEKDGKELRIQAKKGVVMTLGGFSHSQTYREKYLPQPTNAEWTSSSEEQFGDFIAPSEKLDAKFNLMDRVWGAPSVYIPGSPKTLSFLVAERAIPNMIIVNSKGNRFVNEGAPYHDFIDEMYKNNKENESTFPSWMILDEVAKKRYLIMGLFPGQAFPKAWIDSKEICVAPTIEELAEQINIPSTNLTHTIKRFNELARKGEDVDFNRGKSVYDRYYADPSLPNPCLHPIEKGPFYALKVVAGDIGTKGGLVINSHAQVVKNDGSIVNGLYAAGNTSASIVGKTYPGPGATIGPAMVFGYLAVDHMLNNS